MRLPRPRPWDVVFALAGTTALVGEGIHRGTRPAGIVVPLALVACLPLAWSSRAPLAALLGATLGLLACLAAFRPYDTAIVVLALALYSVASLGDRRRSLLVGAGTAVFVVVVITTISPDNLATTTGIRLGVVLG